MFHLKQLTPLYLSLDLGYPYHEVFMFIFWFKPIDCPYKFDLGWCHFCLKSSFACHVFNIWPQANRTYVFHYIMDLGPSPQVSFIIIPFLATITIYLYGRRVWNPHAIWQVAHDFTMIKEVFCCAIETMKKSCEQSKFS